VTEDAVHPTENLAAYALGALEGPEGINVETHVATCATCGSVLEQYRAVVSTLPMGLDPVAPPPEAWAAIRAEARRRRSPVREWAGTGMHPRWRRAMWPVLTTLVASLLVWNVMLQRELTRRAPGPAPGPEVEALSRRPGRLVILTGTGQPGARARLFVAVDGGGHLAISGLTPLPRERTYQLWFIRTGASTVTGGTFKVDTRGLAWVKVTVPANLDEVRAIVVTEEPAPGSVSPTGHHLLEATTWR
jgi:anti-sigma-K factor RskA